MRLAPACVAVLLLALAGPTCDRRPPAPPLPARSETSLRLSPPRTRDTAPDDAARGGAGVCPEHGLPLLREAGHASTTCRACRAAAWLAAPDAQPRLAR